MNRIMVIGLLALLLASPVTVAAEAELTPRGELAAVARLAAGIEAGIALEADALTAGVERLRGLLPDGASAAADGRMALELYRRCVERLSECSGRIEGHLERADHEAAARICGAEFLPLCFDAAVCLATAIELNGERG